MVKKDMEMHGLGLQQNQRTAGLGVFQFDEPESLKRLRAMMAQVEFKVAVAGTGRGAGVSTFTWNLALALGHAGWNSSNAEGQENPTVGILDLGGSTFPPRMGPQREGLVRKGPRLLPVSGLQGIQGIKVVSLNMLMGNRLAEGMAGLRNWHAVYGALGGVAWEGLDILLIELPSGIEAVKDLSEVLPAIDAGLIVTLPTQEAKERVRKLWKLFDSSNVATIGLVMNRDGRSNGEDLESMGRTFGIPMRVAIPYEPALTATREGTLPYILSQKAAKTSNIFFDFSEDLVDYLLWLHDEHEQEEDF